MAMPQGSSRVLPPTHIICETCGTNQLRKNIKRHLKTHKSGCSSERIRCHFKGFLHTFSTKSNPSSACEGCASSTQTICLWHSGLLHEIEITMRKPDAINTVTTMFQGDFEELDEQFRQRPRGGRKRTSPPVEAVLRKRVTPPSQSDSISSQGSEFLSWLLSAGAEDQQ
ncbi:unnamed protein product, partial [Vitis vinifera]